VDFYSFASNVAATVIGGILLSVLFFWAKERLFPIPLITGKWFFEMKTTKTSYNPYKDMILRYEAFLWREGSRIEGSVEKIYENSSKGERKYVGPNRTRGSVSGYVEKNYLGKDLIYLHVVEAGHGRESTNFYKLSDLNKNEMVGTFQSMVANQSGIVKWQRESF